MSRRTTLIFLLLLFACQTRAQTVQSKNGDIIYRPASGLPRRITSTGKDFEPTLSPDRSRIVFIRRLKSHAVGQGIVVDEAEICTANVTGGENAVRTVFSGPVHDRSVRFGWLAAPQFSPDNATIYFLVPDWSSTSGGLFRVDVATGRVNFVAYALKFWVVPSGGYKGNLIVHQAPLLIGGGRADVCNMIDPSGTFVGLVGFSDERVEQVLSDIQ